MPEIPKDTPKNVVLSAHNTVSQDVGRDGVQRPYTRLSVAKFLGWTKKDGDRLKPNYACTQAFAALELIGRKLLKESDFRGQFQRPVFY